MERAAPSRRGPLRRGMARLVLATRAEIRRCQPGCPRVTRGTGGQLQTPGAAWALRLCCGGWGFPDRERFWWALRFC